MCGRFSAISETDVLKKRFKTKNKKIEIHKKKKLKKKFNIAPKDYARVVRPNHELDVMRWGLVPKFAKDESFAHNMINARAETLLQKKTFEPLFRNSQRCLIPSEGFFEFPVADTGKQAWRIALPNDEIFAYAGLYSTWSAPGSNEELTTFTIITCEPNKLLHPEQGLVIHDRMPVILKQEDEDAWLNPDHTHESLLKLLQPYPADSMRAYETTAFVRNAKNESEECWQAMPDAGEAFDWLNS